MPLETFSDVVGEALQFGFNDGPQVNRDRVKTWVNDAQHLLARQVEAPEFQETESIVLVPSVYKYNLPADFLRIQDIVYELLATRLWPVDQQQFDVTAPALFQGSPDRYTLYQGQLWLFPCPSAAETLLMRYFKRPATLVNDSDIPTLNGNYLHLLVAYAVWHAYEAEDDIEMAQYWMGRYEKSRDEYASDVQDRSVDGPNLITGMWGEGGV